jgi:polyphosphate kinase 2 (PPK2 family)
MLEQVDLDQSLAKPEYKRRLPDLQARLYDLEHAAFCAKVPVAVVFEGWAAAGKGGAINLLAQRLDPRGCRVVAVTPPRTAETHYPWLRRFWLKIPAYGQMVIYDTSWYRRVLIDRVARSIPKRDWERAYRDIADFEKQLADDGTVIVKFWLHISKKEQGRRFKKLLKDKLTTWQVSDEDRLQHKAYEKYLAAVEDMLARTEAPHAPWTIVEATDRRFTRVKVFETLIRALENRLEGEASTTGPRGRGPAQTPESNACSPQGGTAASPSARRRSGAKKGGNGGKEASHA